MKDEIRIGIVGYGRLGRGVELSVAQQPDMTLAGIYSRRSPGKLTALSAETPVESVAALEKGDAPVDVLILCGGSRDDLPHQSPRYARQYNIVDSYDHHARIPEHLAAVDEAAQVAQRSAIISSGWDPGLFSLQRLIGEAFLPEGKTYTFWGEGVSQGHSDVIRRLPGVAGAVQYTIPLESAIEAVEGGEQPELTAGESHRRECYVVLAPGADAEAVREAIVSMPDYFEPYQTQVHFITQAQLEAEHAEIPHGGYVIRSAETGGGASQLIQTRLALGSNPEFTASVLVAYARAAYRLCERGDFGAKTVFDIAPVLLSAKDPAELYRELL
ncbi:diaminopimelate dehydrogenase [Bradymonas sediminis]|uniref:Meso-diaminopimelate D-dehydrogenase n=1 Tax=Bradymonas sediminis TaxID=1548548 RepID=A0A2Z4FMW5_9DELT|nr:diaminopimelate dehydrogenase [Bradymonas sediminis]AWV90106.1 diaminopimelate dehydrogenase [Bradymonas sediminis]TDP75923.1 diaminopimelate dehydrogenase [Bradymonas sediminis]